MSKRTHLTHCSHHKEPPHSSLGTRLTQYDHNIYYVQGPPYTFFSLTTYKNKTKQNKTKIKLISCSPCSSSSSCFPLVTGSGGVAYGFIAANTASHERSKHIMAYRSVCMLGILSATLCEYRSKINKVAAYSLEFYSRVIVRNVNFTFFSFPASATFLPGFGSTGVGDSLCLNRFTAPAAFSILLMTIALLITAFLLDEEECVPTGLCVCVYSCQRPAVGSTHARTHTHTQC